MKVQPDKQCYLLGLCRKVSISTSDLNPPISQLKGLVRQKKMFAKTVCCAYRSPRVTIIVIINSTISTITAISKSPQR